MTDILTLMSDPMPREQKLELALKMARSWMHCVEPRLLDTPNFKRDMEALDAALSAPKAEAVEQIQCERCQGNGEIVTNWERYRHPHEGDVGDEAVSECPDCSGAGHTSPVPALTDEEKRMAEIIEEENTRGACCGWSPCSGCHETSEGAETGFYHFSRTFQCHVGGGCHECGGLGVVWQHYSERTLRLMEAESASALTDEAVERMADWLSKNFTESFFRIGTSRETVVGCAKAALLAAFPSKGG